MKKFVEVLTDEQKECLKGYYIWGNEKVYKLIDSEVELTKENFRILFVSDIDGEMVIATTDDIQYWDPLDFDFDYHIGDGQYCLYRQNTPEEVINFIDKELKRDQYK